MMPHTKESLLGIFLLLTACDNSADTCIQKIEDVAQYGYKNEFVKNVCDTPRIHLIAIGGRIQNGFGSWRKIGFTCLIEKQSNQTYVFEADVAEILSGLSSDKRQELCASFERSEAKPQEQEHEGNIDTILNEINILATNIKTLFATTNTFGPQLTNAFCAKSGALPSSVTKQGNQLLTANGYEIDIAGHDSYFTITYSGLSAKTCAQLLANYHKVDFLYNAITTHNNTCGDSCENKSCQITFFAQ